MRTSPKTVFCTGLVSFMLLACGWTQAQEVDPTTPITVGPREAVGKESFGDKAMKSVLSGVFSGNKKSSRSSGPKTQRDPTRKTKYTLIDNKPADLEVGARAQWEDDGLLVSCRIEDDGQKGTFQSILLQDCEGRLLYPADTDIYKLWSSGSISVSWSSTTTSNGQVTGTDSGGWSGDWSDEWGTPGTSLDGAPALWREAGFARAHGGIRQMGATFNVAPEDFGDCDLAIIAHVTRPEQSPVVTEPAPFLVSSRDGGKPVVTASDRETISVRSASAVAGPCIEALLHIEEKKSAFLAQIDDPSRYLQAALAAARDLGRATQAAGATQARLAFEQSRLENARSFLEGWDAWYEGRMEQREERRMERYGSREPSWAKGSRQRADRKHQERTRELREQVAEGEERVEQAQQAANAAQQAMQSAQSRFDRALEDFKQALARLRNAKDEFAELVVRHYRCSPCEVIASHWASAARLQGMLDRLAAMLAKAQARVAAQLPAARQAATEAAQAAENAKTHLAELENRRSQIEQEMRDAVDTSDGCLSLEPQEGWGWMNMASMDGTRRTVVAEGTMMSWKSSFKGVDVRVWAKPGCTREKILGIKWSKVNELNNELHDLQAELAEAEQAAAEAQMAAAMAQAAVDGLEAEERALNELEQALRNSGIEQNTKDVLERLDTLSQDCEQEMKEAIRGAADARKRTGKANGRIAGAGARADGARRKAGRAADDLDDMDSSPGSEDDQDKHEALGKKARDIAEGEGIRPGTPPSDPPGLPGNLEEAEAERKKAEAEADEAEERAEQAEAEAEALEDEVDGLEDEVDDLARRLREWRRYHQAMAAYEDCLRKKQAALEELAELNKENASALQELAKMVKEAADGIDEAADQVGDLGKVNKKAKKASEEAADLASKLERISNAMEVIDAVMRADDLTPSEKLEAMSKAFEELREWLPELPGVSEMLEFYNEAMKAIAGKLKDIENEQIKAWTDLVEAGIADPEDAPIGIRKEVAKAARIRELMKIVSRNCGKVPKPPSTN